jgi:hypothetical protein
MHQGTQDKPIRINGQLPFATLNLFFPRQTHDRRLPRWF